MLARADVLSTCARSAGGSIDDGTACGLLSPTQSLIGALHPRTLQMHCWQSCRTQRDMVINSGFNIYEFSNTVQTGTATVCGGNDLYSSFVYEGNVTDTVARNWFCAADGHVDGSYDSLGFSKGSNTLTDPGFSSTTIPAAPSCGTFVNVPVCMAPIICGFTRFPQATAYGYQRPVSVIVSDEYFPLLNLLCKSAFRLSRHGLFDDSVGGIRTIGRSLASSWYQCLAMFF